jgi:diguanylate cyclase (GGDEF)-like protein
MSDRRRREARRLRCGTVSPSVALVVTMACIVLALIGSHRLVLAPLLAVLMLVSVGRSVDSARKEREALRDGLTGLPNRVAFTAALDQCLVSRRPVLQATAVLLIDLDRFKEVNDTLGHQAGDALLRQIGPRIAGVLRPSDLVARLGGDEFAVLLVDVFDGAAAREVSERIADALVAPFPVAELNLEVEASIGIAMSPHHGTTGEVLLQRSEIAMYQAKSQHARVEVYDPQRDHHSPRRLGLLSELRAAIADGQVILHHQPKLDLRTGLVVGTEALVRWIHPTRGVVPPTEFVPMTEHTGLIRPLTVHVLHQAAAQAVQWSRRGLDLSVAVNISARSLHDGALVHDVSTCLEETGLAPRLLYLEITESTLMSDPVRAKQTLEALASMGVQLSIDDFGTGYSSLAYLHELPVCEVKIDRSFVSRVTTNQHGGIIVRSTIRLARDLGLRSLVEGVEDADTLEWFRDAGCDHAQGFHIGRPMAAAAFDDWLIARTSRTVAAAAVESVGPPEAAIYQFATRQA